MENQGRMWLSNFAALNPEGIEDRGRISRQLARYLNEFALRLSPA